MSEILDCGADFGESADGIEAGAKRRSTRTAVEISEKMDMHLHRRKRVLGRNMGHIRKQQLELDTEQQTGSK